MISFQRNFVAAIALLLWVQVATASPGVGDAAPTLGPIQWLGDAPPAVPAGENANDYIFVVEMFASWNTDSLNSVATIMEMGKAFSDQGVVLLVITNEDADGVADLAAQITEQKGVYFGCDVEIVATENWADDIDILPMMYVLTKDGKVAWRGNPVSTPGAAEQVVRDLAKGEFNMDDATNAELRDAKYAQLEAELRIAYQENDKKAIFRILDQLIATKPDFLHPYSIKRQAIINFQEHVRLPAHMSLIERRFRDSPEDLAKLIEIERSLDPGERNLKFMIRTTDRLLATTDRKQSWGFQIAASVYADLGMFERAVVLLEQAADIEGDAYALQECEKLIAYYKNVIKLRKQIANGAASTSKAPAANRE